MMEPEKADIAIHEESTLTPTDGHHQENEIKPSADELKLDKHGLPLVPQPPDNEDDPLV